MAINMDKALYRDPLPPQPGASGTPSAGLEDLDEGIEVELTPDAAELEWFDPDDPDGMALGQTEEDPALALQGAEFDANLAEILTEDQLARLSNDLITDIEEDLASRADWEQTYADGIKLLGLKKEEVTDPWPGACSLTHPMLTEAVVRFQSETIMETFPAAGPVKTNIVGVSNPEKEEAAKRVRDDMNYQITEVMTEFRHEHERMLWHLPLAGSAFKKVYFDPNLNRQVSMFVPAEDIIKPYGASSLHPSTCPRVTHRMKRTEAELRKLQLAGFYADVDLTEPDRSSDEIQKAKDEETGFTDTQDNRYTLYETHVLMSLEKYMATGGDDEEETEDVKPYVVTIDKGSGKVLSIRRNWHEEDVLSLPRQHFVEYVYIPGFGAYGFGLIHLIGNYARGATAFLRQLGDAGQLSNLPGGFKTRGMRVKNENEPIKPGEFRDVDVVSGALRDNIVPMPYKEPSQVLSQLLGTIVEDGRRLAATADLKVSDMSAQAPVGTTLAILERMLKVMSAVQARVHYSLKQELRLLAGIIRDYAEDEYSYDVEAQQGRRARKTDYELVEIVPVSDPNAATMSQKIVQYQAVMQLATTAPHIYNLPELHRQMLDVLGVKNIGKLIPTPEDMKPVDPITENMALLTGKPVKAFIHQDHDAHLTTHMAAMQDPLIQQQVGQNPKAREMQGAFFAHVSEHMAFKYRNEIEQMMGTPLPPPDQPLPPQVEVQLSRMVAQAAQKLLGKNTAEAQAQAAQQAAQDPILQQQNKELEIKEKEVNRKVLKDMSDVLLRYAKLEQDDEKESNERFTKGAEIGLKMKQASASEKQGTESTQLQRDKMLSDNMLRQQQLASKSAEPAPKPRPRKKE